MELQTFAKIGICAGIAAIVIFSVIATIGASNEIRDNWIRMTVDNDKVMKKMMVLPSVVLFTEKYPDHYYQEYDNNRRGNVGIEMYAYDFETGNKLRLSVQYDTWDEKIRENVRCDIMDNKYRKSLGANEEFVASSNIIPEFLLNEGWADEQFAYDFIKYTNCLDVGIADILKVPEIIAPEYGDLPTYRISVPQGSGVPGCEEIAHCFEPDEITIKVGEIIEWKNYDDVVHTITSGDPMDGPTGLFDSGLAEPDATYALKFNTPGEYPYFCMVHPWQEGMITVTK